jgi:hypothetical protein
VAKVLHEGYFLFAALGFRIMAFGILEFHENVHFRVMAFGILEFHENVHFRIMGFGLLSSRKGIFGKLGFEKSFDKDDIRVYVLVVRPYVATIMPFSGSTSCLHMGGQVVVPVLVEVTHISMS